MANFGIQVDWQGLEEFERFLDHVEESLERVMKEEYKKYGLLLEEGAKALAPEDTGDLAASINFSGLQVTGSGIEGTVGTNLVYALRRHEEPYRGGTYPKYDRGSKFPNYYVNGRGAGTRHKAWRGYPAGRKYLENAVKACQSYYEEMLERILHRAMNGG